MNEDTTKTADEALAMAFVSIDKAMEAPVTTTKSGEEILAILLKHQKELEAYAERLDDMATHGKLSYVQQHIKDRWFYTLDAKQSMLQAILEEVTA